MQVAYNVLLFVAIVVAIAFGGLVLLTGKGDAMSGGGNIRTTFKGRATFDDYMSRLTLGLGVGFFVLMLLIDSLSNRMEMADQTKGVRPAATKTGK